MSSNRAKQPPSVAASPCDSLDKQVPASGERSHALVRSGRVGFPVASLALPLCGVHFLPGAARMD